MIKFPSNLPDPMVVMSALTSQAPRALAKRPGQKGSTVVSLAAFKMVLILSPCKYSGT